MAQANAEQSKKNEKPEVTNIIHLNRVSGRRKGANTKNKTVKLPKKIIFGGSSSPKTTRVERKSPRTDAPKTEIARSTTALRTENNTKADNPQEKEIWVSRVNPSVCLQEETIHNVEPPTMTISSQLEASNIKIMDELVATVEKVIETEEDTPLFRRKLQRVVGVPFIAAATKKDRNLRPLINFVKKRDWEAIRASYGQYWHNIWNRLHV